MRSVSSSARTVLVLCVLLAGLSGSANAAPLGLTPYFPDITASFITTTYRPATGALTLTGYPSSYFPTNNPADEISIGGTNPSYSLVGSFNNNTGAILGPTSFSIFGNINGGSSDDLLLGGTITQFGFNGPTVGQSTILEFVIAVTSGVPAFGSQAGVILSQLNFGSLSGDGLLTARGAISDNFAEVPEPATIALFGLGLSAAAIRRRKKQ